jgi:hypothetical protein
MGRSPIRTNDVTTPEGGTVDYDTAIEAVKQGGGTQAAREAWASTPKYAGLNTSTNAVDLYNGTTDDGPYTASPEDKAATDWITGTGKPPT